MEAQVLDAEYGQPFEVETVSLNFVKEWVKAKIGRARRAKTQTSNLSLALVDGSRRGWRWAQRKDNLLDPIHAILDCFQIPREYCWFSSALVRYNSFPYSLDSKSLEEVDLDAELRYVVASDTFGVAWVYFASCTSTVAVAWSVNEDHDLIRDFLSGVKRHQSIMSHPLIPGMLASMMRLKVDKRWAKSNRHELYNAQIDSGYHGYQEVTERPPEVEPASLSVRVSGIASHISTTELCLSGLQGFLSFLIEENDKIWEGQAIRGTAVSKKSFAYVRAQLMNTKRGTTGTLEDMQSCQKKASIVIQGLFSRIAKRDQEMSIQIGKDSMEIARAAKKDSTSMKAIAGVTMIFLPGTFLASLFSTPLFEWNSGSGRLVTHELWIYWVITIPITLATLVIYFLWGWPVKTSALKLKTMLPHGTVTDDAEKQAVKSIDQEGSRRETGMT